MNTKYNEENTKKVQELTKKLEEEFARRNYLLTQCNHIVAKANREQERQLLELLQNSDSVAFAQPYPSEDENKKLREKLLTVIDFALTICHEECDFADVCDMDSWGERNIERCALKRMKKELQEKEQ